MASESIKRLILNNMFSKGAERRKAKRNAELLMAANLREDEQTAAKKAEKQHILDSTAGRADEWLGNSKQDEKPEVRGLFDEQLGGYDYQPKQQEQPATGLYRGVEDQTMLNTLDFNKGLLGQSDDRYAQKEAISNLTGLMKLQSAPKPSSYSEIKRLGAPERMEMVDGKLVNVNKEKVQSGVFDPNEEGGVRWLGSATDPRNMYVNTRTGWQKTNQAGNQITQNVYDESALSTEGEVDVKTKQDSIDRNVVELKALTQRTNLLKEMESAVMSGADSGPIADRMFSISTSAIMVDNILNRMALMGLKDATLTPVSDADIRVLKEGAMPKGLNDTEKLKWVRRRIEAEDKLFAYYADMNEKLNGYTDNKGNRVAPVTEDEYIRSDYKRRKAAKNSDKGTIKTRNGKKYRVFKDNTMIELK